MFNYGYFFLDSKESLMQNAAEYWYPGKVSFWTEAGTPMVIDCREGYFLYDMSGKRLIDVHLNGRTAALDGGQILSESLEALEEI